MSISSRPDDLIGQPDVNSITDLEKLCLSRTANGMTSENISDQLKIPVAHVEEVLDRVETKLQAKNRFHAVCLAISMGLVRLDR